MDRTLIAALLLEVAWQALDSVNIALFLHHLVQHLCIFHGADGKRGGEVVAVQFLREPGRFGEAQLETLAAACASFGFVFKPARDIVEFFRVVFTLDQRDRMLRLEFGDEPLDFFDAVAVFLVGGDVWIVVEERNLEVLRQVFDGVAAAGCATGVQQKRRHFAGAFQSADNVIQVALVIMLGGIGLLRFHDLLPVECPEGGNPVANRRDHGEGPHDRAFLVGGAKEDRRRIERQVQRKEECENARHHKRDNFGQNEPCRK